MISVMLQDESDLFKWDLMIEGPGDTVFEGGVYSAKMTFPSTYPNEPPKMIFTSPIFHPNIYPNGEVRIIRYVLVYYINQNLMR